MCGSAVTCDYITKKLVRGGIAMLKHGDAVFITVLVNNGESMCRVSWR